MDEDKKEKAKEVEANIWDEPIMDWSGPEMDWSIKTFWDEPKIERDEKK